MKNKKPHHNLTQIPTSSSKLTKEKAYILGTLCGDGYLSTGYRIGLNVCDKEFAQYFRYCLWKVYSVRPSIVLRKRAASNFTNNPKPQYGVMSVAKLVVLDLLRYSKSFKTFKWTVPEQIKEAPREIQAMFIKGFADSEGSVKNRHRNREIILCSGNRESLNEIGLILDKTFKIKSSLRRLKNNVYVLNTGDYKSLKIFYDDIGFVIKRKQDKLRAGLARYKRKGIRKYSLGFKQLALDMLDKGYNYQEIGKILNTSYANVHDWEKAAKNPNYYKDRWRKCKTRLKDF